MPPLKNPRAEAFCQHYARTGNGGRSVVAAGYEAKTWEQHGSTSSSVCANQLLKTIKIQQRVAEIMEQRARRLAVTEDRWLKELACIGFADAGGFYDDDGNLLSIADLPQEARAAVASFEEEQVGRLRTKTKKVKCHSKTEALRMIGQAQGYLVETHEHGGIGGGPIEVTAVKQEIAGKLARLRDAGNATSLPEQPERRSA